jgi:hypothetical protein
MGRGWIVTSVNEWYLPLNVTLSSFHSRRQISICSAIRFPRAASLMPQTAPSSALAPPATIPVQTASSILPFEIRSRVAHWRAKMIESRIEKLAMQATPSLTREVAAESAPSSKSESGRVLAITLSPTQTESNNSTLSASCANAIISGQLPIPKNKPRWGIVSPKLTRFSTVGASRRAQ